MSIPGKIWLDGLYMAHPFRIEYGRWTGRDDLVDDSLAQLDRALTLTRVDRNGLYAHGYDESRSQHWADPETGRSEAHWARSIGWLAMALVDAIEIVGEEVARQRNLWDRTTGLLAAIAPLQQPEGLWLQVIDQPDLEGNYMESSSSAMFAYACLKAARLGLPAPSSVAEKALGALACRVVPVEDSGMRVLTGICHMAGLGTFSDRRRDGSPRYYLSEPVVFDDPKGVGPLMMAVAEAERAGVLTDAA